MLYFYKNKVINYFYLSHYDKAIVQELITQLNNNINKLRFTDNQGHGIDISLGTKFICGTTHMGGNKKFNGYFMIIEKYRKK
jgi:hypothetical protein